MAMRTISVPEFGRIKRLAAGVAPRLGEPELTPEQFERLQRWDERSAAERDGELLFEWRSKEARAKEYVGVVQWRDVLIEILPKVASKSVDGREVNYARGNLRMMLCYAHKLEPEERGTAQQAHEEAPLSDWFIELFATRLRAELFRGRAHGYREVEEHRSALRGRLVFAEHVRANAARADRFFVRREEWSSDTELNRAFKAACGMLERVTQRRRARELLGECRMVLEEVSSVAVSAVRWDTLRVDRQSARFESLLTMARLLVSRQHMTGRAGDDESFSLIYPMDRLYEQFVAGFIRREVLPTLNRDYRAPDEALFTLRTQGSGLSAYLFREERDGVVGKQTGHLKPDLMVEGPGELRVVLDTKWKHLTSKKAGPSSKKNARDGIGMQDLYQMVIYGHVLASADVLLVYPSSADPAVKDRTYRSVVSAGAGGEEQVCVSTTFLDMGLDLRKPFKRKELRDVLIEALGVEVVEADEGDEEGDEGEVAEIVAETIRESRFLDWGISDVTNKIPAAVIIDGERTLCGQWLGIVEIIAKHLSEADHEAWVQYVEEYSYRGRGGRKMFSMRADELNRSRPIDDFFIAINLPATHVFWMCKRTLEHFGMFERVQVELSEKVRKRKRKRAQG
jgi:5-methylcytosine-specific restriction enzyme subunit McrC